MTPVSDDLDDLEADLPWRELGACFDTDSNLFIPPTAAIENMRHQADYTSALLFCSLCMVTQECLDFALEYHQDFGVWGGLTPQQRTTLRRRRRRLELVST